jgi:uncharacterized membrane protein
MRTEVVVAIVAMGVASYACRMAGFLLMRYVTLSPALGRCLRAIPLALMGALLGPVAFHGGAPEWAGLVVAVVATALVRNEFIAMSAAVTTVALLRAGLQ